MLNFTVAGFYTKSKIINKLLDLYKKNNNFFKSTINTLYDSLPNLSWNGGRVLLCNGINSEIILNNIQNVNSLGIGMNFVFTNFFIKEKDLLDKDCNEVLKILSENNLNGVVVSSTILGDYIIENYPNLKVTLSLTYFYNNIKDIGNEVIKIMDLNKYDKVVISPDLNSDFELLNKLNNKTSIELLINETCYKNCIYKSEHYKLINYDNINNTECSNNYCQEKYLGIHNKYSLIDNYMYLKKYQNIGIEYFKISARSLDDKSFIYFLSEYLIEDEYKETFFDEMSEKPINNIKFSEIYKQQLVW